MIFVTTVTCARNIHGKITSFYIDTGGFTAEHGTRASDNGDRLQPIKISAAAPLRKSHPLERRNASRVPVLGYGWENLGLSCRQADVKYQHQIPDMASRTPSIIADPVAITLFCASILSSCDWIASLLADDCCDMFDVSAHALREIHKAVAVISFFMCSLLYCRSIAKHSLGSIPRR